MTVETKLPYDKDYIEQFSKERNEPEWMRDLRLQALEQADVLEMPKPDKTKIGKWNFSRFKHLSDHQATSKENLPTAVQELLDQENASENVVIQSNQSIVYAKLSEELQEKGVIFTDIFT